MPLALTPHAQACMQQRGICPRAIDLLLDYGRERHVHGCVRKIVYFDKTARRRLARANPALARVAGRCRTYAIQGADGGVVTVGHRYRYRRLPCWP